MNTPYLLKTVFTAVTAAWVLLPALVFGAESAPFASTLAPTFITEKTARLNCRVTPGESASNYAWFEWGIGNNSTVYETIRTRTSSVLQDFSVELVGLSPSTSYFFRCVSENDRGRDVGQTTYFTTKQLPKVTNPIVLVRTLEVVSITENSAKFRGYAAPHGTNNANAWFEYGTTNSFGSQSAKSYQSYNSALYEVTVTNLVPGTTYVVRAVGENEGGKSVGETITFTTKGATPSQSSVGENPSFPQASGGVSSPVTNIPVVDNPNPTSPVITMNGSVDTLTALQTDYGAEFSFRWLTEHTPGYVFVEYGETTALGKKTVAYSMPASGKIDIPENLYRPNTTYYYRGVFQFGDNPKNRIKGKIESVKTLSALPNANPQYNRTARLSSYASTLATTNSGNAAFVPNTPVGSLVPQTTGVGSAQTGVPSNAGATQGAAGTVNANANNPFSPQNNPFSALTSWFTKKVSSNETSPAGSTTSAATTPGKGTNVSGGTNAGSQGQVAGATSGNSKGIWSRFWDSITGKDDLELNFATNQPTKAYQTVEYLIRYKNGSSLIYRQAVLHVIFPGNVIYVGDDTNNEFMVLDQDGGGERTYILKLGDISPGESRTITMLGVMTSDTDTDPTPRIKILHGDGTLAVSGSAVSQRSLRSMIEQDKVAQGVATSTSGSSSWNILPNTFFEWLLFTIFLVVMIIGYIKGKAYYEKRRKEIEEEARKEAELTE